jgi:dienelactone hydrolase
MWYLSLFAVLLLLTSGIFLIVRRKKGGHIRLKTLGIVISFILAVVPLSFVILFPPHKTIAATGNFAYTHTTVQYEENRIETYKNDGSNRKISAIIYYPTDSTIAQNTCPLVVFSHGAMGYAKSNISLYEELASHGYVVISIDHTYQALWTKIDGKTVFIDSGYMKEMNAEDAGVDPQNSYERYAEWMDIRMGDIDYVIDCAKEQAEKQASFYKLIDADKIAVIGHSLGGAAALGTGRARSDISAVIALEAPFMYDIIGVHGDDFIWRSELYPVPVLSIYTDSAYSHLADWKQYAENAELLDSQDSDVQNIYIEGCNHFSITDLSLISPILTRILGGLSPKITAEKSLKVVSEECLMFLDSYLK